MRSESVSLPSVSSRLLLIESAIVLSSSPMTLEVTAKVGASATAFNCTSMVELVEAGEDLLGVGLKREVTRRVA